MPTDATDASGALNIGKIVSTAAGVLNSLFGREELEILARADPTPEPATDESGALKLGKIISTVAGFLLKREEMELMRREDPTDESGALNIGHIVSTAAGVLNSLFGREELELMSRADPEDEAGALNIGKIVSTAAGVLGQLFNREELELMARADPSETAPASGIPTDESGAINFGKIISTVAGIASNFLKREEMELMAREPRRVFQTNRLPLGLKIARGDAATLPTDESGALNIGHIISTVAGIASNFLKREDLELLAREDATLPTDESGALNIGHIISTVAGLASNFLKREDLELLAREPFVSPSIIQRPGFQTLQVPHHIRPLIAREIADLLERDDVTLPTDESGALNIGHIISTVAGIASNFLKREEFEMRYVTSYPRFDPTC